MKGVQQASSTEPANARWIALFVTMIAGLLASIQSTALIVALTTLTIDLKAQFLTIMWVLLAFMLAVAAVCPLLGFFADSGVKGSRCFMFNIGFTIFGVASLLAGFSQPSANGIDLVMYRALMGVGAAFIFNNSAPILADKFYPYNQVGLAQGLWGMSFAMGSILGPVVGGGLLNSAGWQWIFWFNVPICAVGSFLGFWKVQDPPLADATATSSPKAIDVLKHFDFLGAFCISGGLACFFICITTSTFPSGALQGDAVVGAFAGVAAFLLIGFGINEYALQDSTSGRRPIVDFKMFHNKDFALLVMGSFMLAIARGSLTFGFIFFFQGALGKDPLAAGILTIPQGLGTFLAGFPAGKYADVAGYRNLCVIGAVIAGIGCIGAAVINRDTNYWGIAACLFIAGLGSGIYNSPSSALGVLCVPPERRGMSSALRFMITLVAQMFAIVICFKLIVGSLPPLVVYVLFLYGGNFLTTAQLDTFVKGFSSVMWICAAMSFALALCSIPLSKKAIKATAPNSPTVVQVDEPAAAQVDDGSPLDAVDMDRIRAPTNAE